MMNRSTRYALVCATLLATHAASARAEDAEPDGTEATDAPAEGAEGTEATGEVASEPAPPATAEAPASRWPRAVFARQLTLPKSLLQLGIDLGANFDFSIETIRPSVGYGITDKLEAGFGYRYGGLEFSLVGYENRIRNLIQGVPPSFLAANVGRALTRGVEGSLRWRGAWVDARVSASHGTAECCASPC